MADFAKWGYAIGEALGSKGDEFLTAYSEDKKVRAIETLEANQFTSTILAFMEYKNKWKVPYEILDELVSEAQENNNINYNPTNFPENATSTLRKLNEFEDVLMAG